MKLTATIRLLGFCLAAAICTASIGAQTEHLSAQLFVKKTDAEIEKIIAERTLDELKEVCENLLKHGDAPELKANFTERVRLFRVAQNTARKIHYSSGEATALYQLGKAYLHDNQQEKAVEFYEQSLAIAAAQNDLKFQATTLNSIAYIFRMRANYDQALKYLTRALPIYEALGDPGITSVFSSIGAVHMFHGDYQAAEAIHQRGLEVAEKINSPDGVADSLFHLGIVNRLRGNYGEALRYYHQARIINESLKNKNPAMHSTNTSILRHIGGAYFLQGNLRLALDYALQAQKIDEQTKDISNLNYGWQFIASIRFAEKNYAEAAPLAERTVPVFETIGDKEGLARSLALLGNINLAIHNYAAARDYFGRALILRQAANSRDGMATARIGLARVSLAEKKPLEALDFAGQAAKSVAENGNRELLWQAQSVIGQAHLMQNDCAATRRAFDAAIETIESLRGEVVGGASENSLFFAERIKPYQQLAMMLAGETDFTAAFAYAERAKARVLLDAVRYGRIQPTALMTAEEQTEENSLRDEVNTLNARISKLSASPNVDSNELKIKLEAARLALARFHTNLYAAHPQLKVGRGAIKPIEVSEIGNLIDEKSALLEYLVTDDAVLLFVITKSGGQVEFKTHKIAVKREALTPGIGRFRQMLAGRNVLFAKESRRLYDLLLRPAAAQIAGKTNLIVVPHDELWELPFQALQSAENRYVLDDAAVSYTPSLTILRELRAAPKSRAADTLLAFGNPTAANDANFAALPEAEKQTLALQNLYGAHNARVFNRSRATETLLKSESAKQFAVLHLATHGVLDNNSPLNSYVMLAPGDGDDGKLEAWEILEMNLPAEMVVLSACETARGGVRSGEGLIGLAWSLMVAGSRNVVVSQWKVESSSTTDLTVEFYQSLKRGNASEKPESLRRAALKLRRSAATAHPFYWAGFVLIGEAK